MNKRIPIFVGILLVLLAVWLQITRVESVRHWINRLEQAAYDIQIRAKLLAPHRRGQPLKTAIAIVDIDDESLAREGRWPWPRSKLAKLVDQLQAQGAVVIAFDMLFTNRENNIANTVFQKIQEENLLTPPLHPIFEKIMPYFDNDTLFAHSLSKGDSIAGISFVFQNKKEGIIPPPSLRLTTPAEKKLNFYNMPGVLGVNPFVMKGVKYAGFINVVPDEDGIIRHVPLLIRYHDGLYPSLALEAVQLYLLQSIKLITAHYGENSRLEGVQLGQKIIPTNERGEVIIPFRGASFTFPYYSATHILHNQIPAGALAGKIIFVGTSAVGLGDVKSTAIQTVFPGVEINATVADGLLKHDFPYKPAWALGAQVSLIILLGISLAILFAYLGPKLLACFIILIPLLLIMINNFLSDKTTLVTAIFIPMVMSIALGMFNIIYGYLFETRRRQQLKEIFGQYVPAEHIDEMLKNSKNYGLLGEDRNMTVLFADIRNFTNLSEGLSASQLKEMLNEFFTPMTEIIFHHQGTIDKYVGDLIMAFWGAPLKDKKHPEHAISAALEMQKKLIELQPILEKKYGARINIGIGLNTGLMTVGDMGSTFRRNYTVLGDAVNLASRVESLTKYYGVKIIVTESTQENQKKFVFRLLDKVRVKGKKTGVAIYEAICPIDELSAEQHAELERCQIALDYYFTKKWDAAFVIFTELQTAYPYIKLYELYIERLAEFAQTPPPADWDGIYTHLKK